MSDQAIHKAPTLNVAQMMNNKIPVEHVAQVYEAFTNETGRKFQ